MSTPILGKKMQENLLEKAELLRANDSFKEAASTYLNSILLERNNADTYLGLGICYKNMGKLGVKLRF